jgi:hypothetical protein
MVVLLAVLVPNVHKPRGMTRYGRRQQQKQPTRRDERRRESPMGATRLHGMRTDKFPQQGVRHRPWPPSVAGTEHNDAHQRRHNDTRGDARERPVISMRHDAHRIGRKPMSTLDVPGARLHYEAHGSGPLMLMVPGASGEAGVFERVTEYLPRTTPSAPTTDAASPAATSTGHRTTTVGSRPTPTMPGA